MTSRENDLFQAKFISTSQATKLWIFSILTGQQKRGISYRRHLLLRYITTEFHYAKRDYRFLAWFVIREVCLPPRKKYLDLIQTNIIYTR